MKRKFLWITDPWHTLDYPKDTTLRLIEESNSQGHLNFWCDVKSIRLENQRALLTASQVIEVEPARSEASFTFAPARAHRIDDFHSIQYRVDPPVDHAYLHPLQLLNSHCGKAEIVNPAGILFSANEKWEGMLLPQLTPPSLISSDRGALLAFCKKEGKLVLKPLHTAQSKGIELIHFKSNAREGMKKLQQASQNFQNPIQLQKFLPAISEGETRLWFVDGRLSRRY
jgi:glutathione synthase